MSSFSLVSGLRGPGWDWSARGEGGPAGRLLRVRIGRCVPGVGADAVQIVDDLAILDGEFADQLFLPVEARVDHIRETEVPFLQTEDGDVGDRTLGEIAEFVVLDLMRWM